MAAIKVMHPHLAQRREYVNMFLDEARISACIDHPNVVRVLDFGKEDGAYYLAMEHLTGKTWYDVWRTTLDRKVHGELQLLPSLAAWVFSQACEGLHTAHEARDLSGSRLNVVHRDVSPQNIFVTFDGSIRLLDFGIASAEQRLNITREGTIKGRIAYMSPEQMGGGPIDRRADVWSMGVLLWEALARQRLFARLNDAATVAAVVSAHVPPIPERVGEVPEELVAIASKALQRNPQDRFATAREMADALLSFVNRSGRLSVSDASGHMAALFADDIIKQRQQRAEAVEAHSLLTTHKLVLTPKLSGAQAPRKQANLEAQINPTKSVLDPTPSELVPTLVTAGAQQWKPTAKVSARIALGLSAGALAVWLVITGPTMWQTTQPTSNGAQGAVPTDRAASEDVPVTAMPDAQRVTRSLQAQRGTWQAKQETSYRAARRSEERDTERARVRFEAQARNEEKARNEDKARSEKKPRSRERRERAEATTDRRTPAAAPGFLNVTTPGCWAVVYADGQPIGMSPGSFALPAGDYDIAVEMQGKGARVLRRAQVRSDNTQRLRVDCQ